MKVLITGGGGFLGAWTIRTLLGMGHGVRVFDTHTDRRLVLDIAGPAAQSVEWLQGDIASAHDVFAAAQTNPPELYPACRKPHAFSGGTCKQDRLCSQTARFPARTN